MHDEWRIVRPLPVAVLMDALEPGSNVGIVGKGVAGVGIEGDVSGVLHRGGFERLP
jgi:hypothetical protein